MQYKFICMWILYVVCILSSALDFLVQLLHSEDETIIGNTALCLSHCADMSKLQI